MRNVIQAGNRINATRRVFIGGGLPVSAPALTVGDSGTQAILSAALQITSGDSDAAIAGGI
jgi:acetyl-CoA C-acetyltransferase